MYFSQIQISEETAKNPYEVHRKLWALFPEDPHAKRSFLFRADWPKQRAPLPVLLQSMEEPLEQNVKGLMLLNKKSIDFNVKEGSFLRFSLCANPVRCESASRRRIFLHKEEEQIAWLHRKISEAADLKEVQIVSFRNLYFYKSKSSKSNSSHRGKISTVTFGGILEVKNAGKLCELVQQGIGPAKSFGCGLLTLARA